MPMAEMKMKAASLHWEFMFARPMHQTPDMIEQHNLLSWVAGQIDEGQIPAPPLARCCRRSMRGTCARRIAWLKPGAAKGKIVVEGF